MPRVAMAGVLPPLGGPVGIDYQLDRTILQEISLPVAGQLAEVELRLEWAEEGAPPAAARAYRHMLQGGGKRLRPLVLLLGAEAIGEYNGRVLQAAVAVEQVHLASVIHDDVVDNTRSRRGRDSVRMLLGDRHAVLVGDYLVAHIYRQLAAQDDSRVVSVLTETIVQMCLGALQEMQWRYQAATEPDYLRAISAKTAVLMQASARLGATCAGADPRMEQVLGRYGYDLGIAFQIRDDLLDLYGDPAILGKPIGQDLQAGQFTLPVIYALQQPGADPLQELIEQFIVQRPESKQAAQATELIERLGGREYAEYRARHHADQAQGALAELREGPARNALSRLADYVAERRH